MSAIIASQPVCPHVKTCQVLVGVEFSRHKTIYTIQFVCVHCQFPVGAQFRVISRR